MPDPAAPCVKQMHLEIPAQKPKPIEVDDVEYPVNMNDWAMNFWHGNEYDEGIAG